MQNDPLTQITGAFSDPRLVALYDELNPFADDTSFYIELARELGPRLIIDVGCGTGLLTCELAKQGYRMIGIDPEAAMLDVAKHRPGGKNVTWVEGYSTQLDQVEADLALMTGHVAQVFLGNKDWSVNIEAIHDALGADGTLAFESRNPAARPWESWTPEKTKRHVDDPIHGRVETWAQFLDIKVNEVTYEVHYRFEKSGQHLVSRDILKFRDQQELGQSLCDAGFIVESIFGDWQKSPVVGQSRELIFIARKK